VKGFGFSVQFRSMILALALALVVTASGALATYLYDEGASLTARLCTGTCTGLAAFGLIGFVIASLAGLTPASIIVAVVITASPFLILVDSYRRQRITADLMTSAVLVRREVAQPTSQGIGYFLFYAIAAIVMWLLFDRAMIVKPEGVYTGVRNNFGDLPFHLSVVTGFAFGQNYPPEDPTYAGVRFTYPFLTDFISAVFVRCGADLRDSLFIENFLLAIAFIGVLHRWAWEMLRDRVAALLTPLLVLLNGGFGWVLLFDEARKNERGLIGVLTRLPASFTVIPQSTWRWGNAISSLLLPQRGILLGLPLAVIVFTQWWLATAPEKNNAAEAQRPAGADKEDDPRSKSKEKKINDRAGKRPQAQLRVPASSHQIANRTRTFIGGSPTARMVAAGIIAGLLPLSHAHTFVVVMTMSACICLLQRRWLVWIVFAVVASVIALPQMWWSVTGSAVNASNFFAWEFGWDHGADNPIWFWFKNTGLFVPLLVTAILWRGQDYLVPRRLLLFYLPFTLCFIIPNMVKMAPWIWDNVKVLFYWWVASAPLVALVLARLWKGEVWGRTLAVALFACLTLAGALDVAAIVLRSGEYQLFDPFGVSFAEIVKQETQPRSTIIHAPVHNTPVFLTGRRSLMGYPGHIWTHGLVFADRERDIKRIYAGAPDAENLLQQYKIDYAVVGPLERMLMPVNEQFFSRFPKVGQSGEYRLYKIAR